MLTIGRPDQQIAPRTTPGRVHAMMAVNMVFAVAVLFGWTVLSAFVADPVAWATWMPVNLDVTSDEIFDYPYILLWFGPLAGVAISWMALNANKRALAYAGQFIPIGLIGLMLSWYYILPH
jgi:hypothetical protein